MTNDETTTSLLARARKTLAEAQLLGREGFSAHKHSGVISLFDQHWVKPWRLPMAMGRFYRKLFELRHQGNYAGILSIDEAMLTDLIAETQRFLEQIEQVIQRGSNSNYSQGGNTVEPVSHLPLGVHSRGAQCERRGA